MQEKTGLRHPEKYALQPREQIATLNRQMSCGEQTRLLGWLRTSSAIVGLAMIALTLTTTATSAQSTKSPEISPAELVRITVANEVKAANHPELHHMFHSRRQTPKGSQTHVYVETNEALAGMLVAVDDKPLTSEQQQAEIDHLNGLINNPDQLRKKSAREKEDEERSLRIVKALPDAFCYEYAGTESSAPGLGNGADRLVKLSFKPNPAYNPPSRVEQVLAGMQGDLLIDKETLRLARIEGTLFREVTFGWGILGHLNKGGQFRVQQADLGLGDGAWGVTEMNLNMSGKILMFKGLSIVSEEVLSDFHRMAPHLTFAQGVEQLKTEEEKLAHNIHVPETTQAKSN
jgi:hypothetical protein